MCCCIRCLPSGLGAGMKRLCVQVWLDGAMARLVVGSKGASTSQCALVRLPLYESKP